jgi:Uma2 family endonuclease
MRLAGATRAADAAIWRRADVGPYTGGLRRVPPVLVVEVAGDATSDTESALREKASWYLKAGVTIVWIALPQTRALLVVTSSGATQLEASQRVPSSPELPDLSVAVSELFLQLDSRRA